MNDQSYIAGGLCLLLLCFLLWNEIKRVNKARRVWRVIATILSVASLYLLAVPLTYTSNQLINTSNDAILLTEGTDLDSLSKFVSATNKRIPVFTFDEKIAANTKYHAALVIDPQGVVEKRYRALHVFGYGIGKNELKDQPVVFHPSPLPVGITSIHWQPAVAIGEKLLIQGRFHNAVSARASLSLVAYNNTVNTISVQAGVDQVFQLSTTPKQLGRAVYSIVVVSGKDTIIKEPVPVQVTQASPLKILVLASSPDFENKFLKNWLAEKGYEVVVRTSISKNKTGKEYLNTAQINIDHITPELLDHFDVVLADAVELNSLNSGELQSIRSAISEKGRGLIVRMDSAAGRTSFYTSQFPTVPADTVAQHSVSAHLVNSNSTLQLLTVPPLLFIRPQPGTQPLISDKENRVLVNSALYGSGKILMSTLPNTYSWMLSGNQDDYNNVWSELITKAAPKKMPEEAWYISPALPKLNEALALSLEINGSATPAGQVAGSSVYLSGPQDLPFRFNGFYWPAKQGWQMGIQLNGGTYYWYAYDKQDWKTVSAAQKYRNTQQVSRSATLPNELSATTTTTRQEAVPKIIFFLLFLIACGYLWFENKYYNG